MAGGSFLSIIRVAMFLLAVWTAGKVSKWVNISTIPMEIAVGVVSALALWKAGCIRGVLGSSRCILGVLRFFK